MTKCATRMMLSLYRKMRATYSEYTIELIANKLDKIISLKKTQKLTISKKPKRCKLAIYN